LNCGPQKKLPLFGAKMVAVGAVLVKKGAVLLPFVLFALCCGCILGAREAVGALEVRATQKISDTQGNFQGGLSNEDQFGFAVAAIGDLDGDMVQDLAVGAYLDDDGGLNRGAVFVLFLQPNGAVKAQQKISDTQGNFGGALDDNDHFGISVTALGDLNGDATQELAVGAAFDNDGGADRGAVYVLFLDPDGKVKAEQKISDTEGSFQGVLDDGDFFGIGVSALGELDGDATNDVAVGAYGDGDGAGGYRRGAVYVLFLHPNGTVKAEQKISDTRGNFQGGLSNGDYFGFDVTALGASITMARWTSRSGLKRTTTVGWTAVQSSCCSCARMGQSRRSRRSPIPRANLGACSQTLVASATL
jgi:FG-GAP repeat